MTGKDLFIDGLKQLGYNPEDVGDKGDNRVAFSYVIQAGRFKDQTVRVGIEVPQDFNTVPPSGPNISPQLIPLNPTGQGNDKAVESPPAFGPTWEYLSRPFHDNGEGWNRTTKDVKAYVKHVKRILETL